MKQNQIEKGNMYQYLQMRKKWLKFSMKYMKYAYMSWLYKVHLIQDAVITQPCHLHFDN